MEILMISVLAGSAVLLTVSAVMNHRTLKLLRKK
ncbi:UNVERIFIED_CONTAM: hypothetical protein ABID98_004411 [Brevibacillus sp. OAP136]